MPFKRVIRNIKPKDDLKKYNKKKSYSFSFVSPQQLEEHKARVFSKHYLYFPLNQ